jgi:hypothetical protein
MGRKGRHEARVEEVLQRYLSTGNDAELQTYLAGNSNLPGPRGNLELANAFADVAARLSAEHPGELWSLVYRFSAIDPKEAPVNDPRELVPFCGTVGAGAIGASRDDLYDMAMDVLRHKASDPRWRTREGVAMGLQRLIGSRGSRVMRDLEGWISGDDWLAMRAVAAGAAEPALLKDMRITAAALDLHRAIIDRVAASQDRRCDEFRALRQTLGYSISVVVSSSPLPGFQYLSHLAELDDKDIRWIVRENLKKKRLYGHFPREVGVLATMLGLSPLCPNTFQGMRSTL